MKIFPAREGEKVPLSEAIAQDPEPQPKPVPAPVAEPEPVEAGDLVDVEAKLRGHARAIRAGRRSIIASVLKMGEHLTQAQDLLAADRVGTFLRWTKKECGLSRSVAYRLIQTYRAFGTVPARGTLLAGIAPRLLQDLASSPEATAEVLDLVESGQAVTERQGRQILAGTRPEVVAAKVSKPDPVTYLVDDGAIVIRAARDGVDPIMMLAQLLRQLRAVQDRREAA